MYIARLTILDLFTYDVVATSARAHEPLPVIRLPVLRCGFPWEPLAPPPSPADLGADVLEFVYDGPGPTAPACTPIYVYRLRSYATFVQALAAHARADAMGAALPSPDAPDCPRGAADLDGMTLADISAWLDREAAWQAQDDAPRARADTPETEAPPSEI